MKNEPNLGKKALQNHSDKRMKNGMKNEFEF